jgi:hypothetical protein
MVEVVNMHTCFPPWGQPGDVKIDRSTKWGNPFGAINRTATEHNRAIDHYRKYFHDNLEVKTFKIAEISDAKRLGCTCKPLPCHGDVLKKAIDEYNAGKQMKLV